MPIYNMGISTGTAGLGASDSLQWDSDTDTMLLAGQPTIGGHNTGLQLIKVTTLTAAQIAALYTTPQIIAPATGLASDEFWQFLAAILWYAPGSTPFTIGSAGNFSVRYTNASGPAASGTIAATGLIDQTVRTGSLLAPISGLITAQAPLALCLSGGNPSGGDGTLHVKLLYRDPAMAVDEGAF